MVVLEQARLALEEVVTAREEVMVVSPGGVQEEVVWPSSGQLEKGAPTGLAAAVIPTPDSSSGTIWQN